MKKWADKKRRPLEFRAGDQELEPEQIQFRSRKDQRLIRKNEEFVKVLEKVGSTFYRVALPTWMKIHLVIHVSNLKPYHLDQDHDSHNFIIRVGITLKQKDIKEVTEILVDRVKKVGRLCMASSIISCQMEESHYKR